MPHIMYQLSSLSVGQPFSYRKALLIECLIAFYDDFTAGWRRERCPIDPRIYLASLQVFTRMRSGAALAITRACGLFGSA